MKRYLFWLAFFWLAAGWAVAAAAPAEASPAPVRVILDQDYYPVARRLISEAETAILAGLFQVNYYPEHPQSPSNILVDSLVAAYERGVAVEVCLHHSRGHLEDRSARNLQVAQRLAGAGVTVFLGKPDQTMHAKFLVVDDRYLLMGSTNWSYYSLDRNRETNLLLDSAALAGEFRRYFDELKSEGRPLLSPQATLEEEESASPAEALVALNTATARELQSLHGIGPERARRIVARRDERPFADIEELLEVSGIGPKVLERIRPYLRLD